MKTNLKKKKNGTSLRPCWPRLPAGGHWPDHSPERWSAVTTDCLAALQKQIAEFQVTRAAGSHGTEPWRAVSLQMRPRELHRAVPGCSEMKCGHRMPAEAWQRAATAGWAEWRHQTPCSAGRWNCSWARVERPHWAPWLKTQERPGFRSEEQYWE